MTLQEASLILFCLKCCDVSCGDVCWWACASLQFCRLNAVVLLDLTIKLNGDDGNRQCPGKVTFQIISKVGTMPKHFKDSHTGTAASFTIQTPKLCVFVFSNKV